MELKTPMVFVKHIIAAQRGNAQSIQYLCERTSGQFVKICRKYDLSNSEIEAVLAKAYGLIFADIKSVRNPQTFMSWAGDIVEKCCVEIAGPRGKASEPAVPSAPEPVAEEVKPTAQEPAAEAAVPAAPEPAAHVAAAEAAIDVTAAAAVTPSISAQVTEAPVESGKKPTAFYDENAYVQPSGTYHAEVNYADEAALESKPADKRVIPVDELVYRPDANYISSGEPAAPSDVQEPITRDTTDEDKAKASVPDPSVYASIPTFASSYEEEAVFQDVYPTEADKPGYLESKATADNTAVGNQASYTDVPADHKPAAAEKPVAAKEPSPAEDVEADRQEKITSDSSKDNTDADEPDRDLVEKEETEQTQDDAHLGSADSEYDEDDDEDDEELQSGLAFRTKVLIGLLCVFIFGACVGIGYAISKGMTARDNSSVAPGTVETLADTIDETEPESLVDSLIESVIESLAESSAAQSVSSSDASTATDTNTTDNTDTAGGQTTESASTDTAGGQTTESQAADPAAGAGGEVTARADIATYLGGTFASVFRDYPDIPRSVYRGELSLADSHIGFIGSYDATQPVSSTIVESVSLLGEGGNYNINGFYVGMTAEDAESLAAAGGYISLEMTAESSREYLDEQDNTLSLTIDGGVVKSITLRSSTADNVTMETADEVTEEVPEEIPGEEGGVG